MDEINPYAPPKSDDARPAPVKKRSNAPPYRLYTPGQICLGTFLGTPASGMYLLSVNRRRLGHAGLATTMLLVGLVATALLIVIAVALAGTAGRPMSMGATFVIWQYACADQPFLDTHLAGGGQRESSWKAAGIGLASLIAVLLLISIGIFVKGVA
jgi:hypothetical protein